MTTYDASVPASTPTSVFETERNEIETEPAMTWDFPVAAGKTVEVRLGLAELWNGITGAGQRVFDVEIDGVVVEAGIDVFGEVGNTVGLVRDYVVTTDADGLDIQLLQDTQRPAIKSIEILDHTPRTAGIVSPTDGETIVGESITVDWTEEFTLDSDHMHVTIDSPALGAPIFKGSQETSPTVFGPDAAIPEAPLPPGVYTITATLANSNHTEYTNPEATTTVTNVTLQAATGDVEDPLLSVDAPLVGAIVPSPVDVLGSASDDVGVTQVQIFIKDRSSGQYWNGSGWQPEFLALDADVAVPGGTSTGWSYEFDLGGLPVAPAGYQATARSLDAAGKRSAWFSTYFDVGVPDVEDPLLSVDAPLVGAIVPSPVDVLGSASDDVGVTQVQIFIKDRSSGQYWNGSGWQPEFLALDADVAAPGATATGWSYRV